MRRLAFLLLMGLGALPAQASTTCSASLSDINFGPVNPFGSQVDVTATLNYSCTISSILSSSRVRMCFSIGAGAQGAGNFNPRQMTSGANPLYFNLYKDSGRSLIWGTRSNSYGAVEATLEIGALLGSASASGSFTVYGRVPAGQTTAVPGNYSNAFSGSHTELVYQYNEFLLGLLGYPASCTSGGNGSGSGSFAFTAQAQATAQCDPSFTVENIDFGTRGLLVSNYDTTAIVKPRCTNTTPYQLGLNNGLNASGSTRRMKSAAGNHVSYELYRDNGYSQRWGNTQGSDTVAGTGTGSAQNVTIYGRVAPQPTPRAGAYSDTVTVTIYY